MSGEPGAQETTPDGAPEPDRPEIFVSYSRGDGEFVRRLVDGLESRGKGAWVDWEDIRKGVDWRSRIEAGIETARDVVAVLSPDFAASAVCRDEIEYALGQQKRVFPILRREVDASQLREELTAPNWIFFRDRDDFAVALDQLLEAIDVDVDWLDQHARLIVRALEWEREGENSSFLLRGRDLDRAEEWIGQQELHAQSPTPLQSRYITASRRVAMRRQRLALGAVVVALVVSVCLTVFAFLQRAEAVANASDADSRALAAEARALVDDDPRRSLSLAVRATEERTTPEALDALRQALLQPRLRVLIRNPVSGSAFVEAHYSADGERVVTSDRTFVNVWDAATGKKLRSGLAGDPIPDSAATSPDGRLVATVASSGGEAAVWQASTGQRLRSLGWRGIIVRADFDPTGRRLLTVSGSGSTLHSPVLWTSSGIPIRALGSPESPSLFMLTGRPVFDPRGRWVVTLHRDGKVRVWAAATGKLRSAFRVPNAARAVFSPHGTLLAVVESDSYSAQIWDWAKKTKVLRLRHADTIVSAQFSPDGKNVLTASEDGTARLWEVATGRSITLAHDGRVTSATFSRDGTFALTTSDDGTARVWEATFTSAAFGPWVGAGTGRLLARFSDPRGIDAATFSRDGRRVLTVSDGAAQIWDVGALELRGHSRTVRDISFSADGRRIVTASTDATARIWSASTGEPLGTFLLQRARLDGVSRAAASFSRDGRLLATSSDEVARVWTLAPRRLLKELRADDGWRFAPRFSRDATRVAVGDHILDVRSGRTVAKLELPANSFGACLSGSHAGFSPDGRRVVSLARIWTVAGARAGAVLDAESGCVSRFSADGNRVVTLSGGGDDVRVRDALSGKQLGVVRSGYLTVNDVALSPDGAFLVTGEQNGTARVWEVTTGRELAVFRGQRGPVTAVSFSPDGRRVAAGSEDGISLVYDCRPCAAADELLEAARVGVVRSDRPRNAAATG